MLKLKYLNATTHANKQKVKYLSSQLGISLKHFFKLVIETISQNINFMRNNNNEILHKLFDLNQ